MQQYLQDLEINEMSFQFLLSITEHNIRRFLEDIPSVTLQLKSESKQEIDMVSCVLRSRGKYLSDRQIDMLSLCYGSRAVEIVPACESLVCDFQANIASLKPRIQDLHKTLLHCCSLCFDWLGRSCSSDDELVQFIDLLLQDLGGLLRPLCWKQIILSRTRKFLCMHERGHPRQAMILERSHSFCQSSLW